MFKIRIDWEDRQLDIPVPDKCPVQNLEPVYPVALDESEIGSLVKSSLARISNSIISAKDIVIIIEDSTRATLTGPLVEKLVRELVHLRGDTQGIKLVIAAGAHYNLSQAGLGKKTGPVKIPVIIHDCADQTQLSLIGQSKSRIPLWFNRLVVQADLRLAVSTVNIHPMAGFSGGGKILLPGVAGLETITAFHSLPEGRPGVYQNEMRQLINESLSRLPVFYSWQLLTRPDGAIFRIIPGAVMKAHSQAIHELTGIVSFLKPKYPADIVFAQCRPFNQNLLGTFKSLKQLPHLSKPGGTIILFNEAAQGTGEHHWRKRTDVVLEQKKYWSDVFKGYLVIVFSPAANSGDFKYLFPDSFRLIKQLQELPAGINYNNDSAITVLPYAPLITLKLTYPIQ